LLRGLSLSFKAYKTYITALFTNLLSKLYKNKYIRCSLKP